MTNLYWTLPESYSGPGRACGCGGSRYVCVAADRICSETPRPARVQDTKNKPALEFEWVWTSHGAAGYARSKVAIHETRSLVPQ